MTEHKGEHDDWESAARHWHEKMVIAIKRAGELERACTRRNTHIKHLCQALRKRKVELAEALKSLEIVNKSHEDLSEKNKWQHIEFTQKIAMLERRVNRERRINSGLRRGLRKYRGKETP